MTNVRRVVAAVAVSLLTSTFPARIAAQVQLPIEGAAAIEVARLVEFWGLHRFILDGGPVSLHEKLDRALVAKAPADECFAGVGNPYPALGSGGTCPDGAIAKKNQSYLWGLARAGNHLWYGTMANTPCWVLGDMAAGLTEGLGASLDLSLANNYFTCEFDDAQSGTGDWRPPHIYRYALSGGPQQDLSAAAGPLLVQTQGIRSATGTPRGGMAFLAGPRQVQPPSPGINLFAFDANTGALLGTRTLAEYGDIRSWAVVNGQLYTAVSNPDWSGGHVLRWIGDRPLTPTDPVSDGEVIFRFEVVGDLDAEGASIAVLADRLYVSTWSNPQNFLTAESGVYRSKAIPVGGWLTSADRGAWTKIFTMSDYEPDPLARRYVMGGALAGYGGELYWGTMSAPFTGGALALLAHLQAPQLGIDLDSNDDGQLGPAEILATLLGTHRSPALFKFRAPATGTKPAVTLLYGERFLPRYDPAARMYTISYDAAHENRLKQTPKHGPSGFGNFFNAYIWSMQVIGDRLYIGTFDWSQLARVGALALLQVPAVDLPDLTEIFREFGSAMPVEGGDLYWIQSKGSAAKARSFDGLDNATNYGVRTIVTVDGVGYVGTANAMNLHPRGGFELIRIAPKK